MKYITISADYLSTGVRDLDGNELSNGELKLPLEIWSDIQNWLQQYSPIIQMGYNERKQKIELVTQLDDYGLEICRKVLKHFNGMIKVEYYSEGLLKKLPVKQGDKTDKR